MPTFTVNVYGIFTPGSASGSNVTQRRARLKADVDAANRTWRLGGTSCINFIQAGTFTTTRVINASSLTTQQAMQKGGPVESLIQIIRTNFTNNSIGIYIVYTSGDYFLGGSGRTIGSGGAGITDYRNSTDFKMFGRVALSNQALGTYALAHEAGHVLLTSYVANQNTFLSIDPSGPYINPQTQSRDIAHNNNPNNIMYPIVPPNNPIITSLQCQKARQSKVVIIQN